MATIKNRLVKAIDRLSDEEADVFYKVIIRIVENDDNNDEMYIEPLPSEEYEKYEHLVEEIERGEYVLFNPRE